MTLPLAQAAVDDLRRAHRQLLGVVDSLADSDWDRPVPYGEWTVKDLIAHTVGDMSPSGPGLILAGILTPEFIADTGKTFDVRARNAAIVAERANLPREDLRQMLFACHDAMIAATLKLDESHLPVLAYAVPMGPGYDLRVEDWLWHGYHDRQHADDIRRALEVDYLPQKLAFLPEIEEKFRLMFRCREGLLRAVYSVADDTWDEESALPGWTYKNILAHLASNDIRHHIRLRVLLGEADRAQLDALEDVDGWNQRALEERRDRSVRELIDEMAAHRYELLLILSRLRPEDLFAVVTLPDGSAWSPPDYIEMFSGHEARHAGQLVAGSRARRWAR